MKAFSYPILKLTISLAIGIIASDYIELSLRALLGCIGLGLGTLILTNNYCRKRKKILFWPSLVVLFVMGILGLFSSKINAPEFSKSHYSHQIKSTTDTLHELEFVVQKRLKSNPYNHRYYVELIRADSVSVSGMLLLNLSKESNVDTFKINRRVITSTSFKEIKGPLNPFQFDYKNYLKRHGIYHQISIGDEAVLVFEYPTKTIRSCAEKIREHLIEQLQQQSFNPTESAILKALLLGQRQDISSDIYEDYTKAGAIHILAISGLHVGIILLILQFLLKPLGFFRYGKFLQTVLILCVLWGFAMVAGLSPSVVRAVTMFSLFAIAKGLKRTTNALNTLAVSAFILLLIRPRFCFDVGFQLSYTAVASIVIVKPILDSWWVVKNRIANWVLDLLKVSIAAQIGVLPLSLFYFHQFPGLFFVTNLIIIPCLILVLTLGILVLVLMGIDKLPELLVEILGKLIQFMNGFVEWVASKESFLFDQISFNVKALLLSYLILFFGGVFYHKRSFKNLMILGIAVLSFQVFARQLPSLIPKKTFIIFHQSKQSLIGFQTDQYLEIHHDLDSIKKNRTVNNFKIGAAIKTQTSESIRRLYQVNNKLLLVVDSLGIYNLKSVRPNWILLRQSPKINLNRLIESLHPELIIWDGSNYNSYQKRWKLTCIAKKIPFHQTSEKGAFLLNF